jgi:hypothetical protein
VMRVFILEALFLVMGRLGSTMAKPGGRAKVDAAERALRGSSGGVGTMNSSASRTLKMV